MIFDIATITIAVRRRRSSLFTLPESFFKDFHSYRHHTRGRVRPDFTITVVPYDSYVVPPKGLTRRQSHFYHEEKGEFIIKSRRAIACVNIAARKMAIGFRHCSKRNEGKNCAKLMGFVRLAVSLCAVMNGGLPFHSSAIAFRDRGLAFSGPSGAGKSTIAKLLTSPASRTSQLLNDDFNIILPDSKRACKIYSTPFTNMETLKTCVHRGVKLHAIYFLEKDLTNKIESLSFKDKYILVLGQVFIFPSTDFLGRKILDNAEHLCRSVACERLHFKNDESFRPFMEYHAGGLI